MKKTCLPLAIFGVVCLLLSPASAEPLTSLSFYVKDKTTKSEEAISHIPQFMMGSVCFPLRLIGKTYTCDVNINTDDQTKKKLVDIQISDPSVPLSNGGYLTIFRASFPFSEKKTLAFDSDLFSASFKVTQTEQEPSASPTPTHSP